MSKLKEKLNELQLSIMIVPFTIIVLLSYLFFTYPEETKKFFNDINPLYSVFIYQFICVYFFFLFSIFKIWKYQTWR